jgi:hypothetical protein
MWLLHPGDRERNLPNVVMTKTPWLSPLLPTLGSAPGYGSVALCTAEGVAASPRSRACAEAAIVCALWPKLEAELDSLAMAKTFRCECRLSC